ncbi:nucleotide-binding alpha-beta plait domain-containing protein [Tanacetum coccineum]
MVLDDIQLDSQWNLSHFLMGRVKEFASLAHLKMTISNEGFTDVKIQYLGEFWVMLEFTSKETMKMFQIMYHWILYFALLGAQTLDFQSTKRIAWVEVEGIPFKLWSSKTFNRIATKWGELLDVDDKEETCYHSKRLCIHTKMVRSISEEFKIIHKGKLYWIRANETPGWVPDFQDEAEDEEQDDNYMKFEGLNEQNSNISDDDNDVERISETMFPLDDQKDINKEEGERDQNVYGPVDEQEKSNKEEREIGQDTNISEDPFKIYPLLHKKDKIEAVSEGRGENVNLDDHTDRVGSYKNCKPPKKSVESGDNSISSGHFKKSELPRTGGSILAVLEEVIKVGTVMGYKMEGCTSNIAEIIEAKGVEEVNFLALQETKMNNMHVKCVRTCWGNLSFDYVHSEAVGNSGGQNLLIGVVYAPHDIKEKFMLWDYLQCEITRWKGQVVIMGDFNESTVRTTMSGKLPKPKTSSPLRRSGEGVAIGKESAVVVAANEKDATRVFTKLMKQMCWNLAEEVPGRDPDRWRKDAVGNVVFKGFTKCHGCLCYEYDHVHPYVKGMDSLIHCLVTN